MNQIVRRIFVEKKEGFDIEAQKLYKEFTTIMGINGINRVWL